MGGWSDKRVEAILQDPDSGGHQGPEQCQDFDLILYLEEKVDQSLVNLTLVWLQQCVKIETPSRVTFQLENLSLSTVTYPVKGENEVAMLRRSRRGRRGFYILAFSPSLCSV